MSDAHDRKHSGGRSRSLPGIIGIVSGAVPIVSTTNEAKAMLATIEVFSKSPDHQLAKPLAVECAEFVKTTHTADECRDFLRDLRDLAVYTGGASSFVLAIIGVMADQKDNPETPEHMAARRVALAARTGISI